MNGLPEEPVARPTRAAAPAPPHRGLWAGWEGLPADAGTSLRARLVRYGGTVATLLLVTAAFVPVRETIGLLNVGLVYLIVVIGATLLAGQRAGILASVLGFVLFNFFLVHPYLTFAISDLQNLLALFVFLGVSLLLSWLIAGAREQAQQAHRRAEDMSRLYELGQTLNVARSSDEVLAAVAAKIVTVFGTQACWVWLAGEGQLVLRAQAPSGARSPTREELNLAGWAGAQNQAVGQGGGTTAIRRPAALRRSVFVPLRGGGRTIGVLGLADKVGGRPISATERTVLTTFADQAGAALERLELLREAQRAELLARTDDLKSALISAVSHDLRTPLASIITAVTSLLEPGIRKLIQSLLLCFLSGIPRSQVPIQKHRTQSGSTSCFRFWQQLDLPAYVVLALPDYSLVQCTLTLGDTG